MTARSAGPTKPTMADVREVQQIDPNNIEKWTPTTVGPISGWSFELRPRPTVDPWRFFAFRSPTDGNQYRIYVVTPNADDSQLFGHTNHLIAVHLGGQRIPVICGPAGDPAPTLESARGHAGYWMFYMYDVIRGVNPGYSL